MNPLRRALGVPVSFLAVGSLLTVTAFAHSPLETSTRVIAMEDRVEFGLTVGLEAGAWLLQDAPREARQVRVVGPAYRLEKEFAPRLFEVTSGGVALAPQIVSVRTDGLEFNFILTYPPPANGALAVCARFLDRLTASLKSSFVVTDENGNISASRVLNPGDGRFEIKLPNATPLNSAGPKAQSSESSPPLAEVVHASPQVLAATTPTLRVNELVWTMTAAAALALAGGFWLRQRRKALRAARTVALILLVAGTAPAQRQMEKLGRGLVVVRSTSTQAYLGWRLLVTEPGDVGFNVYRFANGGAGVKLNAAVLTNTTDFLDTTANFALSNAWRVVCVTNGVEFSPSPTYGLAASSPVRQYLSLPLQPVAGGLYPPYDVKFCWVGDFDGDGEYDYLVDRLSTTTAANQYLQAYKRDGTLLWQLDLGFNSTNQYNIEPGASAISIGDKDNVTVYDFDGDGRAEVAVRTARGVRLPNGTTISGPDDVTQYLSILEGLTGAELARTTITNMWPGDGPLNSRFGVMYCDGIRPSLLIEGENRVGSGNFNRETMAYDFRDGQLTRRWFFTPHLGANLSWGHQLRVMDVNHDGIDDLIQVGSARDGATGQTLFDTELVHGDRFHLTDVDPDRPGLEMFSIQQDNPTLLATALIDMQDGALIKKWYSGSVADVGRGCLLDLAPNSRGCEMYSTQPGIFDRKGNQLYANTIWPPEALWWDADLTREFEDGAGSGAYNPVVNKFNPATGTSDRLYTLYNEDGGCHQAYGGRAAVWGDLFGDWREEFMVVADDFNSVRIYTTRIAATNRLYCLAQNPAYRCQMTFRGYYQAGYLDYYLGNEMPPPPPPPVSDARLVWRGGVSSTWDASAANWFTNWFHVGNASTNPAPFNSGATVLFDLTGSNHAAITLDGSLTPGAVVVHSPKDYTFNSTAGGLAGGMKLTKAGGGRLTLNGTNTYVGPTWIAEGTLLVNGALLNSPVTVRGGVWLDGRIGGSGIVGSPVSVYEGAGVSPGAGMNAPGTLTIASNVSLNGRTLSDFDLSDDPAGVTKTNDLLVVNGNLTLTGTNTLVIRKLDASLPPGSVYPLIVYSGTLSGSLSNLAVSGLAGIPFALTNAPGQVALVIKGHRAPTTISWTGGSGGNAWDLLATSNWLNGVAKDQFAPNDNVRFDNLGTSNLTVNLVGDLNSASVVVDSTANYTLAGNGGIVGSASLTKSNTGTLTISALNNSYTGKTIIAGGTVVVSELDAAGFPSPLGNANSSPTNLVLAGSPTLRITDESFTDRGMTLSAGTNTIDVFNAADQVTMAGLLTGSGALQKLGAGALALTRSNSFSGVTLIKAGSVSFGGDDANQYGFGPGPGGNGNTTITLENSALRMFSDSGSYNHTYWNLVVATNLIGSFYADDRCYLHGTLTGGGTLEYYTYYVRAELDGNWSGFTGRINVKTDSDGGDFRINNSAGYANAAINLAPLVYLYHLSGGAVSIGELSGSAGSVLAGSSAWTIGAKHTDATYSGNIAGGSITKAGMGAWTINGTNIAYTGATTVSAGTLIVNANAAAATGTVTVNSGAMLAGTGTLGGATTVNGELSPGNNGIGTLTINANVTLNPGSTNVIQINKAAGTRDLLDCKATLTYGGTLQVTNLSGTLTNGDSFKIFDATTYANSFSSYVLPPLNNRLAWDTSGLASNGTLRIIVAAPPVIQSVSRLASGGLRLTFSGTANQFYEIRASTNVALTPVTSWSLLGSGTFNGSAVVFDDAQATNYARRFYLIRIP